MLKQCGSGMEPALLLVVSNRICIPPYVDPAITSIYVGLIKHFGE